MCPGVDTYGRAVTGICAFTAEGTSSCKGITYAPETVASKSAAVGKLEAREVEFHVALSSATSSIYDSLMHLARVVLAGWLDRRKQAGINHSVDANRVLKDRLDGQRLRFTDEQPIRLTILHSRIAVGI